MNLSGGELIVEYSDALVLLAVDLAIVDSVVVGCVCVGHA